MPTSPSSILYLLPSLLLPLPAFAQLGPNWTEYKPDRKIHLAEDDPATPPKATTTLPWPPHPSHRNPPPPPPLAEDAPATRHQAITTFPWSPHASVGKPTPHATYDYDAKTDTETFRLLDPHTARAEIRLFNEYATGSRQFEGYVTFDAPLNDE